MSPKFISLSIILAGIVISAFIFFSDAVVPKKNTAIPYLGNVYVQAGKQIVEINAKGGFEPKTSNAKAGIPTTLQITTNGTFDCSSVISIPELGVRQNLPATGVTKIDLGTRDAGVLHGTCGMGMYPFTVEFK
ncbi:MAG: cupredoxin domain-containing protein [Candidatus Paceibacterota bacterium]|jgi:plastocyanin domain-containing protein